MNTKTFEFNGKEYAYFDHPSNQTYANERRVEIPIAFEFVEKYKDILEVGNVIRHYNREYKHDIIDLYEQSAWPIWNKDILTWTPKREYPAILSISTVEHTSDPVKAVKRILSFAPKILITFPVGRNADHLLDADIKAKFYFLKRAHKDNLWQQIYDIGEVRTIKYNKPYPYGNCIVIISK